MLARKTLVKNKFPPFPISITLKRGKYSFHMKVRSHYCVVIFEETVLVKGERMRNAIRDQRKKVEK
jgi:hypothetical protein